jgi:hypothetical protein
LELRLGIEGKLIRFYQEDTQEKLLIPDELVEALKQATQARLIAEEQAQQERQQRELAQQQLAEIEAVLDRYRKRFGELPK